MIIDTFLDYNKINLLFTNLLKQKIEYESYYNPNYNNFNSCYKVRHYIKSIEDRHNLIHANNDIEAIIKLSEQLHLDDRFYLDNFANKENISNFEHINGAICFNNFNDNLNNYLTQMVHNFYENDKLWLVKLN